jgi:DNA-binding transcriptional ArsR family regulator
MVNYSEHALDATFAALAHPARRAILRQLGRGEAAVKDLARPLKLSLPAIAKHLAVLQATGLIVTEKRGRERYCRLRAIPLQDASAWLDAYRAFWVSQLEGLDTYLTASRRHK